MSKVNISLKGALEIVRLGITRGNDPLKVLDELIAQADEIDRALIAFSGIYTPALSLARLAIKADGMTGVELENISERMVFPARDIIREANAFRGASAQREEEGR